MLCLTCNFMTSLDEGILKHLHVSTMPGAKVGAAVLAEAAAWMQVTCSVQECSTKRAGKFRQTHLPKKAGPLVLLVAGKRAENWLCVHTR